MFEFIILVVLLSGLLISVHLHSKYQISVATFSIYRPVNRAHKWFENIMLIVDSIIIVAAIYAYGGMTREVLLLSFILLAISTFVRGFMEYRHFADEKGYIIDFLWAIAYSVIVAAGIIIIFFF